VSRSACVRQLLLSSVAQPQADCDPCGDQNPPGSNDQAEIEPREWERRARRGLASDLRDLLALATVGGPCRALSARARRLIDAAQAHRASPEGDRPQDQQCCKASPYCHWTSRWSVVW